MVVRSLNGLKERQTAGGRWGRISENLFNEALGWIGGNVVLDIPNDHDLQSSWHSRFGCPLALLYSWNPVIFNGNGKVFNSESFL